MKNFFIILTIIIFTACGNTNTSKSEVMTDNVTLNTDTTSTDSVKTKKPKVETLNFIDSKGQKQGKWVKKWKEKNIEIKNFKDNILNGYYFNNFYNPIEGYYKNGKKEGMFFHYYDYKSKFIAMESFYKNDTSIWDGFPACDKDRLVPLKDFGISRDTVFIQAPDYDGNIWYEGNFCMRLEKHFIRKEIIAYGIHKVYFKNGKLKGFVDYGKQTIQEFDTNGTRLYKAKFNEFDIHKQTMRVY